MDRKANNLFKAAKKIWVSRFLLLGFFGQFIVADSLQADPLLSSSTSDSQKVMPALVSHNEDQNKAVVTDQSELQTLQQNNLAQNPSNLSVLPVSISNAQAAGILIQAGYFTQAQYDEFIAGLSFNETYSQMSSDDFMKLLVGKKIVLDSIQSVDDLKAALKVKGVDVEMAQLRPDGILQALGNPVGGSLLKFPETDLNAVIKSKAALESQFQTVEAKKAFLEYFSTEHFLELLGGKKETQVQAEFDPFFGLSKHIGNLDLINIDPDFLVKSFNPSDFIRTSTKESDILAALSNPVNIQSAIKRLAAMPEGARLVYIGGPILYDFYDSAGRPISDFDPLTITKDGVTYTFEGYSMSNWVNTVQKRMDTFMAALKAGLDEYNRVNGTNVKVDYLMIDYEEKTASNYELNGQNYEPDLARPGYNRRKPGPSVWEAIMQDSNWAKIQSETGLTKEDIVAGLDKNGNLTGSSTFPRVTAQIWNIYQERQRALNFYHSIMEPTHKYFADAVGGSFEDGFRSDMNANGHNFFRFTNMWGGLGGLDAAGIHGLLPSEGLRLADYNNTPNGNMYFNQTNFDQLLGLISITRANIQVSDVQSLHWLSGPDIYNPINGEIKVTDVSPLPYYAELAFHTAMNGADQLFFQTSSWSTQAGHAYTEAIMQELNDSNLFAYTDRKPITYDSIHSDQDFLVSGVQSNGKNIYRVSWESGPLSGVLINDGTNGQPVVFKKGDSVVTIPGGRIYIPAGGEIKTFSFDNATNPATTTGAWVIVDDISAGKILNQNVSTLLKEVSKPPLPSGIQSFADDLKLNLPSGYTVSDPVETKAAGIYTVTISAPASIGNGDLQSANFLIMTDSNDKTVVLPKSVKLTFKNISNSPNGEIVFTGMTDLGNAVAGGMAVSENPLVMISKMKVQEVSSDGLNIKFTYNGDSYFRTGMVYNDPQNGSMMRSGWIHFPNDDSSVQNLPLVLSFHGGYGTGAQQMVQSLMNDSSDQAGYAVVYLDGFMSCWNAVIPTASSSKNVDDVGFVDSFLDSFISKYHVDTNKIYLTGISNGGQMVYRLASESKYTFAGVALVSSGILNTDDYQPKADTPILIIHGTADTHIPYAGGVGSSAMNPQNYLSINSLLQYVQQLNGIPTSDLGANYLPYPDFSSLKVSSKVWGSDKNEVVMITVSGGVHTWFGANFTSEKPGSYAYHAISANQAIWNFFSHHALNSIPSVDPEVKSIVDGLAAEMPGYVSEITFAPKGSSKPYIVTFNYAQSALAPTGQLQSLSFFVDKSGNIELKEIHYSGITTEALDAKVFFTGLSNIPYGKENPIVLMSKLQMESVTLASGIYYANFKLNSESWRIYVENSVVKINKRLSDAVRSYRDSLRKDLGPNYSVDVFPDSNTPFLFSLTVSYKGTAAIADGQLESMSAKILNQDSIVLSNLKINFHNLNQPTDPNLLLQGLGQLVMTTTRTNSSDMKIVSLIRVSSVDSNGTIHFSYNNEKWKISKDANASARLEKDIKVIPANVQSFSDALMASMPGSISKVYFSTSENTLPYLILVTNPSQEKGKLAYLGFYIDDALNIQFVGANYWGIPANKPDPKIFFEGLSNIPYGKENPISLMMKLKIESITLGTDGTEYTNFILNGEYWRIYQKSGVTRITKRRSPEVIDYENQLQKNLGSNFIVDVAPDSTTPFTYKAVIYPAAASSVKGSFKAMEYTIKSSDGKMSFDFKNLKVHFNGIIPDPDPNLLNLGLMQLNSSDPLILMTQIRITSVDAVNNIIYFNFSNLSWKIYKDATGRVRLEAIPIKK